MRNRFITTVFLLVMPFTMLFGQNYNKLWEAVREAEAKDLPKTQMEALQKIVDKATRDDDYGQLLKAELQQAKVQLNISPDSLDRIISDLERQALAYEHTQPVMAAVLNAVLGQVYCSDSRYGDEQHSKGMACFEKSLSKPLMLAATKTAFCPSSISYEACIAGSAAGSSCPMMIRQVASTWQPNPPKTTVRASLRPQISPITSVMRNVTQ